MESQQQKTPNISWEFHSQRGSIQKLVARSARVDGRTDTNHTISELMLCRISDFESFGMIYGGMTGLYYDSGNCDSIVVIE